MPAGLSKPVAATGEDGRHLYTCPLCEAMCGLEITVSEAKWPASAATATTPGAAAHLGIPVTVTATRT